MIPRRGRAQSEYMEWTKLSSSARFNLATSGMASLPLAELEIDANKLELTHFTRYGYEPLVQAIAQRYRVAQECVASAMGTTLANYLALAAATEAGDEILVEHPSYDPLLSTARFLGLELRRFRRDPENGFAIDLDDLQRNLTPRTRVIVLCNLHNPSGAFTPDSVLEEIGELAKKHSARVLADEVYLEMLFEAAPRSAFHIDPERFISTNSLTKAYGLSGLRCGWVLASPELVGRMNQIQDMLAGTYPAIAEQLSVRAFEKLPEISARMKSQLETNRGLLKRFLESRNDLSWSWPEYGTMVFPRVKNGGVETLCSVLRDDFETSVVPGRFFECDDRVRMGVGTATADVRGSLEQLGKGLDHFAAARR